jgi:hypothetical protein
MLVESLCGETTSSTETVEELLQPRLLGFLVQEDSSKEALDDLTPGTLQWQPEEDLTPEPPSKEKKD